LLEIQKAITERSRYNSYKIGKQYFLNSIKQDHILISVITENKYNDPEANNTILILGAIQEF